jgi:5'-nucleotidase/UDP-sugar diphosphatase
MIRTLFPATLLFATTLVHAKDFTVTILHNNDVHARIEPVLVKGEPFGGYARTATIVQETRKKEKNVLFLSAGDVFQGTLYFTQYSGLADGALMNYMQYDAMALGNHEFDLGPAPLARFVNNVQFPVLAANLSLEQEPSLQKTVKPYVILERERTKIGVVGLITPDTPNISGPGPTVKFLDPVASTMKAVGELEAAGVKIIIVLSHLGYQEDLALAKKVKGVDVILGGHSHTLLGSAEMPPFGKPLGPYPTSVTDSANKEVLVAQAYEWGKVLGHMKLTFDSNGYVKKLVKGESILVDKTIKEDPIIKAMVDAFAQPILTLRKTSVGETSMDLGRSASAEQPESLMGNVIADSMLEATRKAGAQLALMNQGGIRASMEKGNVTFENAINVQPFGNTLVLLELTGAELKQSIESMLEHGSFHQVSAGFSYTYKDSAPVGQKVVKMVFGGREVAPTDTIRIVTNNFMAKGGDFQEVLKNAKGYRLDTGLLDVDALIEYFKLYSPIQAKVEGRVVRIP